MSRNFLLLTLLILTTIQNTHTAEVEEEEYPFLAQIRYMHTNLLQRFETTHDEEDIKRLTGMVIRDYGNDKKQFEAAVTELEDLIKAHNKVISADVVSFVHEEIDDARAKFLKSSSSSATSGSQ